MKKLQFFVFALSLFIFLPFAAAESSLAGPAPAAQPQLAAPSQQILNPDPMDKSVNLRLYVPQIFVGYLGGVWDIALSDTMTFGPIVRIFVLGKYSGYDFGVNVNYSLTGDLFKNGWILNPYLEFYHADYNQPLHSDGKRNKVSSVVLGASLAYQWMLDNGFNVTAGLGIEYADEKIPVSSLGNDNFHPHYEITVGYAF
jgi:hypothetical protein